MRDWSIIAKGPFSSLMVSQGIRTWRDLTYWARHLPYGRNSDRNDLTLVISEQCGTCSSKHALLKAVAEEQAFQEVELFMGIYLMNEKNTPGVGMVLEKYALEAIPEAHCYLSVAGEKHDLTFPQSDMNSIQPFILTEKSIAYTDVFQEKIHWHQTFIQDWVKKEKHDRSFAEVWSIREQCIQHLSNESQINP
jgi:cobalamin biosynthesis Co2+ chelatase CbiK